MISYQYDEAVEGWLERQIGTHFANRPSRSRGMSARNYNLRKLLPDSVTLEVTHRGQPVTVTIPMAAEFVAFQSADATEGVIAAVFESIHDGGGQYRFVAGTKRLVYQSQADLRLRHSLDGSRHVTRTMRPSYAD